MDMVTTFKKHQQFKSHSEAVEAMVTLSRTTKDTGEQLNREHRTEKNQASYNMLLIMSSNGFLARKGLALPYNHSEVSANLLQLLYLRAEDKP